MVERLKRMVSSMILKYIDDYQNAGLRDVWVAGTQIPSKRNVRKAFLMNIGMIREIAQLHSVSDKILGITDDIVKELKDMKDNPKADLLDDIDNAGI
tara:strand:- start:194 stop:484 length:291 start_codon:yes stop_codon:yes gene_type:complete